MISRIKYLFIFLPLLLAAAAFSQPSGGQQNIDPNGYNKFYYDNGVVSSEGMMKNGKPEGYWKTYLPNGKLKSEGNRKSFLLDSVWKFYDEKGNRSAEINYKAGKKEGSKKTFDKDGKLITDETYSADVKEGETKTFYPSGKVKFSVPFKKGQEDGSAFEYSEDGSIITVMDYKVGFMRAQEKINRRDQNKLKQGKWKEFFENGIAHYEFMFRDDTLNGYSKEFNKDGTLKTITKYEKGKAMKDVPELSVLEMRDLYYADGRIKSQESYKEGKPEGTFKYYDTLGKITDARIYKDGDLIAQGIYNDQLKEEGHWKEFHPDGQLKGEGDYKNGLKSGEWKYFHPNGKLEQFGKYDAKGRPNGAWKWFHESGNPLREEVYSKGLREGTMTEYSDSGSVITKGEYSEGLKQGQWMYTLGDYKEEGEYKDDVRVGVWKHYYTTNNQLRFQGNFIDGQPEGKHKYFYANGKLRAEGKYAGGKKDGDWTYMFYANSDEQKDSEGDPVQIPTYLIITYRIGVEERFDGTAVVPLSDISDIQ